MKNHGPSLLQSFRRLRSRAMRPWALSLALMGSAALGSVACQAPQELMLADGSLSSAKGLREAAGKSESKTVREVRRSSVLLQEQHIRSQLQQQRKEIGETLVTERVERFYADRDYAPAWVEGKSLHPAADDLVAKLANCEGWTEEGGKSRTELEEALNVGSRRFSFRKGRAVSALAEAEVKLTTAYIACSRLGALRVRNTDTSTFQWDRGDEIDTVAALEKGLAEGDLSEALSYLVAPHEQASRMIKAIGRYQQIVDAGGWPRIADGPTLEPGEPASWERLNQLSQRLEMEGFLPEGSRSKLQPAGGKSTGDKTAASATATSETAANGETAAKTAATPDKGIYDDRLAQAVADFQAAHGLEVDSKVGPSTLESLNVTAEERLHQLEVNLERTAWLPIPSDEKTVLVNLPAYRLQFFENQRPTVNMKVVVGQAGRWQTPIFADRIEYLVVNPSWNVPRSIQTREILPKLRRDPSYLAKEGLEVVKGYGRNAQRVSTAALLSGDSSVRLRQPPGPDNALGRIKFIFPNSHNVYLHDTPAQAAFDRADRARSHGCVRVAEPMDLARALLGDSEYRELEDILTTRNTKHVNLETKVPVYLIYMTAWVNDNGQVEFYRDVYDEDGAVSEVLRAEGSYRLASDRNAPTPPRAE